MILSLGAKVVLLMRRTAHISPTLGDAILAGWVRHFLSDDLQLLLIHIPQQVLLVGLRELLEGALDGDHIGAVDFNCLVSCPLGLA